MKHPFARLISLFLILLLLTACGGMEIQKNPVAPSDSSESSTYAQNPKPTHDPNVVPQEDEILEMVNEYPFEVYIYWDAPEDFGPTKAVTVYDTVPIEEKDADLLHDEILWNTLLPGVDFDTAEDSGGSYNITATIDGQSCRGTIGNGSFDFFLLSEIPDSLAPERVLEKLSNLIGMELELDEKDHQYEDYYVLYRGILDGLPVDDIGYVKTEPEDCMYCGPRLAYQKDGSGMFVCCDFKLGSPAEVIPAENMISPEIIKNQCITLSKHAWAGFNRSFVIIFDRAELGYYLTTEMQLRPAYIVSGNSYIRSSTQEGKLARQSTWFVIDAETGEMAA